MPAKKSAAPKPAAPELPIGDEAVLAKTGRHWEEWFAVLDAAGAQTKPHPEIVAILSDQHGVGPWWRQMVTVGYEQARGLREAHETTAGFQMSASKTIAVPVSRLYEAFTNTRGRGRWLPGNKLTVRTAVPDNRIRIRFDGGDGALEANFAAKGDDKGQVTVTETKLKNRAAVERQKAYWKQALDTLKQQLEP